MTRLKLWAQCKNKHLPIKVMRELIDIMVEYEIVCLELREVDDNDTADYDLDELDEEE